MPTPEEQFTEALRDVNDTLEEVKVTLVQVRDVTSIEPVDSGEVPNRVMVTDGSGNTTTSAITTVELNYLDNLIGNVQSQLDNKLGKNIGVPNRILRTDANGNILTTSSITADELSCLDGITGNIMTLLDQRVPRITDNPRGVLVTGDGGDVMVHPSVGYDTLGMLAGTTSSVQTQLNGKLAKSGRGAYEVLTTDANGNVIPHPYVDSNELGYLNGLTGYVQHQINSKQDKRRFTSESGARKLIQKLSTGTDELYTRLCTWTTTQDGQKLMIKAAGSSGFNAYSIQQFELAINVNTSNGYDDGAGQGYFSAQCYMHDMQNHRSNVRVYLIQPSSTVCEVWVKLPEYCTMVYEILVSADNEVDIEPEHQATAPTTDAKYIYSPQALAKLNGWKTNSVLVTDDNGELQAAPSVSRTELGYLDGASSNIQTQLDSKQTKNLGTANRALVSNGSGDIGVSAVTASQLNMLKNVTSDVQTQINDKQTQLTSLSNKVNANTLVGEVKWLAFSDSVSGWLLCDGRAVSRTDYPALFAVIGTTWGEGDGSTTFNLPNLIDKTVWGGTSVGTYKEAGLPDHDHSYSSYPRHGAEAYPDLTTARWCDGFDGTETAKVTGTSTKASASNSIYGKSATVQPPAAVLRPVIKY